MTRPVNDTILQPSDELAGKHILLSGTTGFVGKVVLSLLLSRFPKIARIYALIRPGISESAQARFDKTVATSAALDPLREMLGEGGFADFLSQKVVPVDGNITQTGCGLSEAAHDMLGRTGLDLIINSAGLVDFDPPVDSALMINAVGAQEVVALAQRYHASLVHVSTCFVAGKRQGQILEDDPVVNFVPTMDAALRAEFDHKREIVHLTTLAKDVRDAASDQARRAQWHAEARSRLRQDGRDPDNPRALRGVLMRQKKIWLNQELKRVGMERATFWGWTNTYTFTKSLGEQVVADAAAHGLRACIVRPSIVESSLEFPQAGWNEGFTTTAPLILLCRQGLADFPFADDLILDIVPCDVVASVIIAAGAACLAGEHKLIYQASTGDANPMTIRQAVELTGFHARQRARRRGEKGVRGWWLKHHETRPRQMATYRHISIPAYRDVAGAVVRGIDKLGVDRLGWARGAATQLRNLAEGVEQDSARVAQILDIFLPFVAENRYVFRADNTRQLMSRLPPDEKALLHYKPDGFLWRDYFLQIHLPGLQKWVLPKLEEEMANEPVQAYMHRDLIELFEATTHRHRHRVAFNYLDKGGRSEYLTYGELRLLARRVAGFLQTQGVAAQGRVLLLGENRPEWVACYFGILLVGATAVPVDAGATTAEVVNLARAAQATGVLLSPKVQRACDLAGRAVGDCLVWSMSAALRHGEPLERAKSPAPLASIIFTSGTTATPKGVMLSQRNFTFEVSRLSGIFSLNASDHLLSVLPLHHTFEFTAGLLVPLSRGARVTYLSELTGDMIRDALKEGVTGLIGVPALWQLLQRRIASQIEEKGRLARLIIDGARAVTQFARTYGDINPGPLLARPIHKTLGGRLKFLVSGGSALDGETLAFFRGLGFNLTEGYGLTETAPVLTVTDPSQKVLPGSVGRPISGVDIRIHAPNDEGVGEVWARGPNVMQGYFGDEEATREVLCDGWLHTGDLGHIDDEGRLFLVGRQKDVIVDADGKNVYPDELEAVYGAHPDIRELSIVGLPQDRFERVACLMVPSDRPDVDRAQLRTALRQHVADVSAKLPFYKRIKVLHFWDAALPRTATRKVKRREIIVILHKLEAATRQPARMSSRQPSDALWELTRGAVAAIAGRSVQEIRPDMRFSSDLAFDSLMFAELAAALERHTREDVTPEDVLGAQSVGDILPLLRRGGALAGPDGQQGDTRNIVGFGVTEDTPDDPDAIMVPKVVARMGRRLLGWGQGLFYDKVMDVEIRGRQNVPHDQGFLVVANHASHLDAGLVKAALGEYGRHLVALAAKDYFFASRWRRAYFENFTNLLPIERHGALRESLRRAVAILERGGSLLIFPEGTRSTDGVLRPFKSSMGYLALASGRPFVPMYLWGTYDAMPKGSTLIPGKRRIGAVVGPAFAPAVLQPLVADCRRSEAYRRVTHLGERAVVALREQGGYEPQALVRDVRDALISPSGGQAKTSDPPAADAETTAETGREVGYDSAQHA